MGVTCSTTSLPTRIRVGHKLIPKPYHILPFTADGLGASGIYFMPRAANRQLIFGSVAHRFESEIVDPDNYNTNLDPDFKQVYLRCLFHPLPGLETSGEIVRAWIRKQMQWTRVLGLFTHILFFFYIDQFEKKLLPGAPPHAKYIGWGYNIQEGG